MLFPINNRVEWGKMITFLYESNYSGESVLLDHKNTTFFRFTEILNYSLFTEYLKNSQNVYLASVPW